jgi:hypothetical protein
MMESFVCMEYTRYLTDLTKESNFSKLFCTI